MTAILSHLQSVKLSTLCFTFQNSTSGIIGCPFTSPDKAQLQDDLVIDGLSETGSDVIVTMAINGNPQAACAKYLQQKLKAYSNEPDDPACVTVNTSPQKSCTRSVPRKFGANHLSPKVKGLCESCSQCHGVETMNIENSSEQSEEAKNNTTASKCDESNGSYISVKSDRGCKRAGGVMMGYSNECHDNSCTFSGNMSECSAAKKIKEKPVDGAVCVDSLCDMHKSFGLSVCPCDKSRDSCRDFKKDHEHIKQAKESTPKKECDRIACHQLRTKLKMGEGNDDESCRRTRPLIGINKIFSGVSVHRPIDFYRSYNQLLQKLSGLQWIRER